MASRIYTSSRPDRWSSPRAYSDPSLRRSMYGAVQPMEEPSVLERLLARFF